MAVSVIAIACNFSLITAVR